MELNQVTYEKLCLKSNREFGRSTLNFELNTYLRINKIDFF